MASDCDSLAGVPASTAAGVLQVTPQAVRNWVRAGILPGSHDRPGRCYVRLDALEPPLRMRQVLRDRPAGPIADTDIDAEIDAVRAERRARAAAGR